MLLLKPMIQEVQPAIYLFPTCPYSCILLCFVYTLSAVSKAAFSLSSHAYATPYNNSRLAHTLNQDVKHFSDFVLGNISVVFPNM